MLTKAFWLRNIIGQDAFDCILSHSCCVSRFVMPRLTTPTKGMDWDVSTRVKEDVLVGIKLVLSEKHV